MLRFLQRTWWVWILTGAVNSAWAFTPLGLFDTWQVERIGYNVAANNDIGGPMNLGDEYRWNIRTIYYGFDSSFKTYFGQRGVDEVRKAVAIINNLPPMSKVSSNLLEFPTDTRRVNLQASALGLLDLKSVALGALVEQLGLASPERYVWCVRFRIEPTPTYNIIKRNFDPITLAPSSYVNDTLYTYTVIDPLPQFANPVADAVEISVDPLAFQFTAVASTLGAITTSSLLTGEFFTGLTRDDVGGLRYIYCGKGFYQNNNVETLPTDAITNGISGRPFTPVGGTAAVNTALRSGIDKIVLKEAKYDSVLGVFRSGTNTYKDTYITNFHKINQTYQRPLTQPDIIFGAADLGAASIGRTTPGWIDNNAINSQVVNAGPGQIQPPTFITFGKAGPLFVNDPSALDEQSAGQNVVWGSFDGTTNIFIYPEGTSISDLEQQVLGGH